MVFLRGKDIFTIAKIEDLARAESVTRLAAVAGITVAFLGCAVLAAWFFDLPVLKSLGPDWATMKPNTALSFLLAG